MDSGQAYATDGIWHMYTITYDAAEIVMYFDGAEVKRQATALIDTQAVVGVGGTSNWDADLLTEAQLRYAATDAWICLKIYNRLRKFLSE